MVAKDRIFLFLVKCLLILLHDCYSQEGSGGDEIDAFFTDSVLRVSEGQNVSVCIMAMGFTNAAQSVTLFRSTTFLNASTQDFVEPVFSILIELSTNVSVNCSTFQIRQDSIQESTEEVVLFRLTNFDDTPVMISVPTLMLIIEPDPPFITVPQLVDVSEGLAAVVCFIASFSTSGEAVIGLSTQDITTSTDDYGKQSVPTTLTFSLSELTRQCIRIPTFQNTDAFNTDSLGFETFSIIVSPINSSSTNALPVLSRNTVTVRLFETCVRGDVRLVNGTDPSQGRVEVCVSGSFATVCDFSEWTLQEALTVCRQLGFSGPVSVPNSISTFGTGSGPFFPGGFSCSSTSDNLLNNCLTEPSFNSPCQPNPGVYCGCVDNSVRLIGFEEFQGQIRQPSEGRVEICKDNQWGTVCSLGWDNADAEVVCRQLNIQSEYSPSILKLSDRIYTRGSGPIFLSDVQCTGGELNISSCTSSSMNLQQCSHDLDAGVRCDGQPIFRGCEQDQFQCDTEQVCVDQTRICDGIPDCIVTSSSFFSESSSIVTVLDELNCTVCSSNEIRPLIGGSSPQEGLVEVCSNGTFHWVPLSGISVAEAAVLCRQLKLGTAGFPFPARDLLLTEGLTQLQESEMINTATLNCTGTEQSISDCTIQARRSLNVFFQEFAAIKCIEASNCVDGSMRLVPETPPTDGREPQEGRLEICYQGIWGSVYDTDWSGLDAAVTCQSLGFSAIAALPLSSVYYASDPAILPVVYDVPECTSLINGSILDCSQRVTQLIGRTLPRIGRSLSEPQSRSSLRTASSTLIRARRQFILSPQQEGGLGRLIIGVSGSAALIGLVGVLCADAVPVGGTQIYNCYKTSGCRNFIQTTSSVENCCESLDLDGPIGSFYQLKGDNQCMSCPTISPSSTEEMEQALCSDEGAIRLVFREQSGTAGLLQMCRNGVWNFLCSDIFGIADARVACRQLGFKEFSNTFPSITTSTSPISGVGPLNYQACFSCQGSEKKFTMCSNFGQGVPFCESQKVVLLRCPTLPSVILDPPLIGERYTVEQGRRADLLCARNNQDYPLPSNITINGNTLSRSFKRFLNSRATVNDSGMYNCTVASTAGRATRSVEILVQGGNGMVTSIGYLRMSFINSQRYRVSYYNDTLAILVFNAIPPPIPGQQTVTCRNATRYSVDAERRLDRFECVIVTTGGSRAANAGALVAQTAITFIQIAYPGLYTNFQVSSVGFCGVNETSYNNVTLEWPETVAGETASLPCPAASGMATRQCRSDMMWLAPNVSLCGLAINIIENVLSQSITLDNYEALSNRVAVALMIARNDSSQQNDILLEMVTRYFAIVSALVETDSDTGMDKSSLITRSVVRSLSQSVAALQQWPANVFIANGDSSSVLLALERVIALYAQLLRVNQTAVIVEEDFVLVAENALVSVLRQTGRTVSFENTALPSAVGSIRLADNQVASIALPPSLFGRITDREEVGVFFAMYTENTLFPVRDHMNSDSAAVGVSTTTTVVGSPVVASTVGPRISFTNLQPPVEINLRLMTMEDSVIRPGSQTCVSWDFNGAGGNGSWSTVGCTTSISCNDVVVCNCTHLTNFAVLVDICSRVDPGGCMNSASFETALSIITYVGVVLSMVGLILTVITLLIFKRLRKRDATLYHVQLCIAVFFMLLVFVAGIDQVSRVGGCVLVSILIHYFTLAAIFWMTAEAALMFHKLVFVFRKVTKRIIVGTSLVCWSFPLIFVIPPLIADLANGRDSSDDLIINRSRFCFLNNPFVFWLTFLVPILLLVICNLIVFGVVIAILVRHTRGTMTRKKEAIGTKTVVRLMISIAGIIFLFGLSWLFAALTVTVQGIRLPAQVLFAVFNSLQGFFIFIFFCVLSEEARESWKELISCGQYKSSYLNPSLKWGKNSKGEHVERSKNNSSSSGFKMKVTSSTALSYGKVEDVSNLYSEPDGSKTEKVDLSKTEEPTNHSAADPEYSIIPGPKKKDLSENGDCNRNIYTALISPGKQEGADAHIYTRPEQQASSEVLAGTTSNGTTKSGNTIVQMHATNNSFPTQADANAVVETGIDEVTNQSLY